MKATAISLKHTLCQHLRSSAHFRIPHPTARVVEEDGGFLLSFSSRPPPLPDADTEQDGAGGRLFVASCLRAWLTWSRTVAWAVEGAHHISLSRGSGRSWRGLTDSSAVVIIKDFPTVSGSSPKQQLY